MLKKIQSEKFPKLLFSYIEEKRCLQIIIYNKEIQTSIGVTIENFKEVSGKYILYESPNKAKEYWISTGKVIYDGDYLNGKRHGKGKEYYHYNGKLIFEGEFLNGKRNGKGKEFNGYTEKMEFDGEYKDGKRHGKGKEYYDNGQLCVSYKVPAFPWQCQQKRMDLSDVPSHHAPIPRPDPAKCL